MSFTFKSVSEVAADVSIALTRNDIYSMLKAGCLPHWRPSGNPNGSIRIPVEVLESLLSGATIDPAWFDGRLPGAPRPPEPPAPQIA